MAKGWKVMDWFRESKPAEEITPAPLPETVPAAEEKPAIDLFPEESASGEKRSTNRRPLGVPASLITGSFATPDPVTVRDISPQGVYFFATYKLAPGQLAEIRLTEPDTQQRVCYHVKVVRAESTAQNQFGIAARITRREILTQ
jgi:hypothetical protein